MISDVQATKAFVTGAKYNGQYFSRKEDKNYGQVLKVKKVKITRSPLSMLLRNFVWKSNRWNNTYFRSWVDAFDPEVVLLQAGDLPAFYDIAVQIAKERNVPLVIYNSEEYYFKNYCYFGPNSKSRWLYPLFRVLLRKSVRNAIEYAAGSIYISDYLRTLYDHEFGKRSLVIMTSATEITPTRAVKNNENKTLSIIYGGNLGIGRHKSLIEIGNALQRMDKNLKISVFGRCNNFEAINEMKNCAGLEYKGAIPYDELQKRIRNADLLIHVESMDLYYVRDIRYGFSTKIADSLASGVPFFVYASDKVTSIQYLKENECAIIATDKESLEEQLRKALFDVEIRAKCVRNARQVAVRNHNLDTNRLKFYTFVAESLKVNKGYGKVI